MNEQVYIYEWDSAELVLRIKTLTVPEYELGHHGRYNQVALDFASIKKVVDEAKASGLVVPQGW